MMSDYLSEPISQFPPGTSVLGSNVFVATDVTDLTESASGTTKKYSMSQVLSYVENTISSNDIISAKYATVSNLNASYVNGIAGVNDGIGATLTNAGAFAALVIDGIAVSQGDRVLVAYQTNAYENGVYVVTDVGSGSENWVLTRASDFDGSALGEIRQGDFIAVLFGNINALSWFFMVSPTPLVVGVDDIDFQKQANVTSDLWINQTTTPVNLAVDTGYTSSAGATLIEYTLPAISPIGAYVTISGKDTGLFHVKQLAGQQIHIGSASTTLGASGRVECATQYGAIKLRCVVANTIWVTESYVGSFNTF